MFNIYSNNTGGHRSSYIDTFKREFQCVSKSILKSSFSNRPLLFLMVDDNLFLYTLCSIFRNLFGFKTAGLIFRMKPYVDSNNFKERIKFMLLSFVNKLSHTKNISILPLYVDNKFSLICSEWIYDPQLWDLTDYYEEKEDLDEDILLLKKNESKVILASIGSQLYRKGVIDFINLSKEKSILDLKINFIFAGKMDDVCKKHLDKHGEHIYGVDRFISDEEIQFMYSISSHIWCSYRDDYDQASGIFGRAVQLGKIVIIRKDSCLHKMCQSESIAHILSEDIQDHILESFTPDYENILHNNKMRKDYTIQTILKIMCD